MIKSRINVVFHYLVGTVVQVFWTHHRMKYSKSYFRLGRHSNMNYSEVSDFSITLEVLQVV